VLGFRTEEDEKDSYERMRAIKVISELKRTFRPEFLNRVDESDSLPRAVGRGRHGEE